MIDATAAVPILGAVVAIQTTALIGLVLSRLKAQDARIENLATAAALASVKADLEHDIERVQSAVDGCNARHIEKNHRQDEQLRAREAEAAELRARLAALEKWRNGKPYPPQS